MAIPYLDQELLNSFINAVNDQHLDPTTKRVLVREATIKLLEDLQRKTEEQQLQDQNELVARTYNAKRNYHLKIQRTKHAGLKITQVKEGNDKIYYINLSSAIGELSASLTRTLLIISNHAGLLSEIMPLVAGGLVLISTLISLITLQPNKIEKHKLINALVNIIAGLLFTLSYCLTIVQEFIPTLSSTLFFIPFIGSVANILMLIMEIGTAVYLEKRYRTERDLILNKSDKLLGDDSSWLFSEQSLTKEQLQFKQALFRNIDSKVWQDKEPEQLKEIFSREHFNQHIKQDLLKHASSERIKRLARHSINSAIVFITVAAGFVALAIPVAGPIIALGVLSFILAGLVAKVIFFNTVLKESKINIEHHNNDAQQSLRTTSHEFIRNSNVKQFRLFNSPVGRAECRLYQPHTVRKWTHTSTEKKLQAPRAI